MGNASRPELCCLMGRLSGDSPEAPLLEVWLPLRASQAPSGVQIATLQRAKSPVEAKFDLQRPFLSGLGSLHGFSGLWARARGQLTLAPQNLRSGDDLEPFS